MLVLSRKINETIVIGGNIRVTMTAIRSRQVRLAIEAPPEVPILREELLPAPPSGQRDRALARGGMSGWPGRYPAASRRPLLPMNRITPSKPFVVHPADTFAPRSTNRRDR